jgi:hypothetical protein
MPRADLALAALAAGAFVGYALIRPAGVGPTPAAAHAGPATHAVAVAAPTTSPARSVRVILESPFATSAAAVVARDPQADGFVPTPGSPLGKRGARLVEALGAGASIASTLAALPPAQRPAREAPRNREVADAVGPHESGPHDGTVRVRRGSAPAVAVRVLFW